LFGFLWLLSEIFTSAKKEKYVFTDGRSQVDDKLIQRLNRSIKTTQIVLASVIGLHFLPPFSLLTPILYPLEVGLNIRYVISSLMLVVFMVALVNLFVLVMRRKKAITHIG